MSKRKTHEEYVKDILSVNPNIEVLEEYINAKTPILHKCKIHNVEWKVSPSNILSGRGCHECGIEKSREKFRKSQEQYIEELALKNPNIKLISIYKNNNTPTLHKCTTHNIEWLAIPYNILMGYSCPECRKEKLRDKLCKTHQQYIEELEEINSHIIPLEEYINAHTPILHKCLKDNYEWRTSPHSILSGNGCPKCSNRIKRTHEDYIHDVKKINNNIKVIENYLDTKTAILHECLICGHKWKGIPSNILNGGGCPKCAGNIKKMHEEYVHELSIINSDIEVIGEYINAYTPILHRCKIDGFEWYVRPTNILSGKGCPCCNESNGERQVRQWLEKQNIEYVFQKTFDGCCDNRVLPFDFYLPTYNSCIEYDGEQHYKPIEHFGGQDTFKLRVKHDKIKNKYCENNGISLLRIPYFKNVEEELNNFLFI